jgi:hypothetical protein
MPSAAFSRLQKLIEEGVVEVLMPYVVSEEWRTQRLEHLRSQCDKAEEALKGLTSSEYLRALPQTQVLAQALAAVGQVTDDLNTVSQQAVERLLQALQTNIMPLADEHGRRVMTAYFAGRPPFASIKSRKDIPDAFVFEAVTDVAGDDGSPLIVVTADKNFRKHIEALPATSCHETLEQFVESQAVKDLTAEIEAEAAWRAAMPAVIEFARNHEEELMSDADFVNSFIDSVAGKEVTHASIPSDEGEARVSMVGDPDDLEVEWDSAEDYGPGVLRVPFRCTSEVLLDFYVYFADAYSQAEHIRVQWADPDERKYFDAQANAVADVSGHLTLEFENWVGEMNAEATDVKIDEIEEVDLQEDKHGEVLR